MWSPCNNNVITSRSILLWVLNSCTHYTIHKTLYNFDVLLYTTHINVKHYFMGFITAIMWKPSFFWQLMNCHQFSQFLPNFPTSCNLSKLSNMQSTWSGNVSRLWVLSCWFHISSTYYLPRQGNPFVNRPSPSLVLSLKTKTNFNPPPPRPIEAIYAISKPSFINILSAAGVVLQFVLRQRKVKRSKMAWVDFA